MDEGSTPTALVKIFGDFDSRVRTASRRTTGDSLGQHRRPTTSTGQLFALRASRASESSLGVRGRLPFDESIVSPETKSSGFISSSKKRSATTIDELDFSHYPKAAKRNNDDAKGSFLEIERLKTQLMEKDVELVSKEADLKKEQALLKKMQFQMAKSKLEQERAHEEHVRTVRREQERVYNLERQLERLQRHREHEQEYEEYRARPSYPEMDESYPSEVEKLMEENVRLRDDLCDVKSRASETEGEMKEELNSLRSRCEELEEQLNLQSSRGLDSEEEQDPRSRQLVQEELRGQLAISQQENKRLESVLKSVEEDKVQQAIMKDKLHAFSKLERELQKVQEENSLLRETADNGKLLKEQNEDLRGKLTQMEKSLQESQLKQEKYFYAKRQLEKWRGIVLKLCSSSEERAALQEQGGAGPDLLAGKISELQQDLVNKTEAIAAAEQHVQEKAREVNACQMQIQEMTKKSTTDKQNLGEQANLIKRFKRKLLLVSKERDSYKGVLESYEHELTFNGATFEKDRITALEESVKEYGETVERLEDLLASARSSNHHRDIETQLREEISDLKAQLSAAASSNKESEASSSTSKVFHFINNPLQQATDSRQREVEELNAEIVALKTRIKLLEEGETSNLTLLVGRKVGEEVSSEEVLRLQNEIESAKKKHDRLIEAFTKKGQEFRNAVAQLTGFQFDGLSDDTMYRVRPVAYTDDYNPDVHLLFKATANGEDFGLVETAFAQQPHVQKMIDLHFHQQASIPMLLAAVIADLYERYDHPLTAESSNFEQASLMPPYQGEEQDEQPNEDSEDDAEEMGEEAVEEEELEESASDEGSDREDDDDDADGDSDDDNHGEGGGEDDDSDDDIVCLE